MQNIFQPKSFSVLYDRFGLNLKIQILFVRHFVIDEHNIVNR